MGKSINIGSSNKNDFVIESKYVTDFHARILVDGNQVVIEDFNTVFGTHVNGKKITVPTALSIKDKVKIGVHLLDWQHLVFGESEEEKKSSYPIYLKDLFHWYGKLNWNDYRIVLLLIIGTAILLPFVVPSLLFFFEMRMRQKSGYSKEELDLLQYTPFLLYLIYSVIGFVFFNLTVKFIRGYIKKN